MISALAALALLATPIDFTAPENVRVYGDLRVKALVDTNFESRPGEPLAENVGELQSHALLGASADFGERARIVVEARLWHRAVEQRPAAGEFFWLVNGQNTKGTLELDPGEAYFDWYSKWVDLRVGNQVLVFGANVTGAPADVLSPIDLREGVLFADEPADVKLPVPAIRARGTAWGFDWTAAYVPFFVPDRYDIYGQDEALVQPGLGIALPSTNLITLAQQDRVLQPLLETDRPEDLPQNGDLGLRVTRRLGESWTVGADYVITREKLPQITLDPELARFIAEGPNASFRDPATALSLSQRVGAGEQLIHGEFPRFAVGELEASALLGPVQVDLDLGHSGARLYYDRRQNPVFHPTTTGVLTVSDARGTDLTLGFTATLLWIHDVPQGEELFLLDPEGAGDSAHQVLDAFGALLAGYKFDHDKFEAELRGYYDVRQRSNAEGLRGTWNASDHVHLVIGYQHFGGSAVSPFGYFRRNDAAWAELRLDL